MGVGGFAGQETLDRVLAHPDLEVVALGSDSLQGQAPGSLDPRLSRNGHGPLPSFVSNDEALAAGAELIFVCLDNEIEPPADAVVVDLSGSHRIGFAGWWYALPELAPPTGRLIANPGCYATAALLALGPIAGIVDPDSAVVDGKSGSRAPGAR